MRRTEAACCVVLLSAGLSCSAACVRHVQRPTERTLAARDTMHAAREAADRLIRDSKAKNAKLREEQHVFIGMEDRGDEIWVTYRRQVPNVVVVDPVSVSIAYNKKSGATRWVPYE